MGKEWRLKNPERTKETKRRYRLNNPEKVKERNKICLDRKPWFKHLHYAKARCRLRGKYYAKGIKVFLTGDEIEQLWFRDKAYDLKHPSIDRKDNKGHYSYTNCQFIEKELNDKKDSIPT